MLLHNERLFFSYKFYVGNKKNFYTVLFAHLSLHALSIFFFITIASYLIMKMSTFLFIIDLWICILTLYNLIECQITNPGVIPRGNLEKEDFEKMMHERNMKEKEENSIQEIFEENNLQKFNYANKENKNMFTENNEEKKNQEQNVTAAGLVRAQISIERNLQENEKNDFANIRSPNFYRDRYCETCKIVRPAKASHCRECDQCVKNFDHHCYFVANCIGERNWGNFILFLVFSSLLIVYRVGCSVAVIILIYLDYRGFTNAFFQEEELLITFLVFVGIGLVFFFICTRKMEIYLIFFGIGILILIITIGKNLEEDMNYYENPIFGIINLSFIIPFFLWVMPLAIINCHNAMNSITIKEKKVLAENSIEYQQFIMNKKRNLTCWEKVMNLKRIIWDSDNGKKPKKRELL